MKYRKITDPDFYRSDTITVATNLLGKIFVHESPEGKCSGIITETEAYCGIHDKACHSYNNRRTKRTETMYSIGGTLYVYMIYGLYFCVNIVTRNIHEPEAVLLRAIQPIEGIDIMIKRRLKNSKTKNDMSNLLQLCNGPGKLTQAMGISTVHNGINLLQGPVYLAHPPDSTTINIVQKPRIGIDYAKDAKEYPWRFYIQGSPYVSKF